jgi:hypothetical protein
MRILDASRKALARGEVISGLKRTRADEPSAGMSDIKRRRQAIELSPVLQSGSVAAAKSSYPKPPEPKSGRRQVIKMIWRNNGKEDLLGVLLDFGATIPILNKP